MGQIIYTEEQTKALIWMAVLENTEIMKTPCKDGKCRNFSLSDFWKRHKDVFHKK